ncbi:hypothetical protein DPEC_G00113470 [Dallia pectoralis]|uniref:Uncharacterized protein n=1 Tax=Dallia pectoralis TaxID=75939 RepID=A0ACC2GU21_DALPE|nr:hypothetical protein DPEC_G00113470 [Dallia pectoralis]
MNVERGSIGRDVSTVGSRHMWVIESGRGPKICSATRPDTGQRDPMQNPPLRPLQRSRPSPINTTSWPICSTRALHREKGTRYLSFVSKAVLWERGFYQWTDHTVPDWRPGPCPRFLTHMKACPPDLRPPRFLSSKPRPRPPQQGQSQERPSLSAPKMHAGDIVSFDSTSVGIGERGLRVRAVEVSVSGRQQRQNITGERRSAAVVPPCVLVPVTPSPSRASPQLSVTDSRSGADPHPASATDTPLVHHLEGEKETLDGAKEKRKGLLVPSVAFCSPGLDPELSNEAEDTGPLASPLHSFSEGSLSDFSRPPSSQFSRSTDLNSGRSSVLSEDLSGMDSPHSQLCSSSMSMSALSSCIPWDSPLPQPPKLACHTPFHLPISDQMRLGTPDMVTPAPQPGRVLSHYPEPSLDPSQDRTSPSFPSKTCQSSLSPQCRIPPWPESGLVSGSPSSSTATERNDRTSRWSVLPPISPVRDGGGRVASQSCCSQISSSQSHAFDELENIAPRTVSCLSSDDPLSTAYSGPPATEMSPGLAALTVGCDTMELGSLSRVQLLLLDRPEPVDPRFLPGHHSLNEDAAAGHTVQLRASSPGPGLGTPGVLRTVAAGSCRNGNAAERCVATGRVSVRGKRDTMSGNTDNGPRSPRSWSSDSSPSDVVSPSSPGQYSCDGEESDSNTSMASTSLSGRNAGHRPDQEASEREEPGCTIPWERAEASAEDRRRPRRTERRTRQKERKREERKTKVLNIYSKLQDSDPLQPSLNRGRSKFEDFNFLAKYCIFSQEKLTEYKRAFEAVDSDRDGYISCLQVLLGLKKIIPSELLSDEEEIYVYRILEMVDFRVTDGLTDLRLFAVIASLAQKIATMDPSVAESAEPASEEPHTIPEPLYFTSSIRSSATSALVFMRSLISKMDFCSLELKLYKAKQLFLFLLEGPAEGSVVQQGCISAEQLLVELKAGGIRPEQEEAIKQELQNVSSLDLLDFLAYLPLFLLIHKSVIANPLDDASNL